MHAKDEMKEVQTMGTVFFHPSILLIPTRYNYYNTRKMIQIEYGYKGRKIAETWYAVKSISLPRWLGGGTSLPIN